MALPHATVRIRACREPDIPAIRDIIEYYVLHTVITLALTPPSHAEILEGWQKSVSQGLPFLVAVDDQLDVIVGFCYAGEFRGGGGRGGYRHTVELSLFCHPHHLQKGAGSKLLGNLIEALKTPERFPDYVSMSRGDDEKVRTLLACMVSIHAQDAGATYTNLAHPLLAEH